MLTKIGQTPIQHVDAAIFVEQVVLNDAREVTVLRNGQEMAFRLHDNVAEQLTSQKVPKTSLISPRVPFYVGEVVSGKPAEKAGVQVGDRILALNGSPTLFYDQFGPLAMEQKGKPARLTLLRNTDTVSVNVTLTSEGTIGVRRKDDGFYKVERQRYALADAIPGGVQMGVEFLNNQMKAFGKMFSGEIAVKDNLGSLISIGKMYGTSWDWERFWSLTASLSILLAFMNLLPIPALDGGYVMFLLWEVATGRKVSDKVMEKAVTVGFFLLLGLMVYAFGLDLWRHVFQKFF